MHYDMGLPVTHDCKLDLVTVQGNLAGEKYHNDILDHVVPHLTTKHFSQTYFFDG